MALSQHDPKINQESVREFDPASEVNRLLDVFTVMDTVFDTSLQNLVDHQIIDPSYHQSLGAMIEDIRDGMFELMDDLNHKPLVIY